MRYRLDFSGKLDVSAPSVSGAMVYDWKPDRFVAWLPSTWPDAPATVDEAFIDGLKRIFEESMLGEIKRVIDDAGKNLQHRGHVVAVALLCALDAIAAYGYRNHHVSSFVGEHFRDDYKPYAAEIYVLYRNSAVHSWHLFEVAIYPDETKIKKEDGVLAFGLLDFFQVLVDAAGGFLEELESNGDLQKNTLARYAELKKTAKG